MIVARVFVALVAGLLLAWLVSLGIRDALMEPEMRNCMEGKEVFFRPLPEGVAKIIAQECQDYRNRQAVIRRADMNGPWLVNTLIKVAAFLADPINLILTIIFSITSWFILKFLIRAAKPVSNPR
jgi:hypothetical protein